MVKGDWEALQEKAKDGFAKSTTALKQMRVERIDGLLDEHVKRKYEALTMLQSSASELLAALKHSGERSRKSGKSGRAMHDALVRCFDASVELEQRLTRHKGALTG